MVTPPLSMRSSEHDPKETKVRNEPKSWLGPHHQAGGGGTNGTKASELAQELSLPLVLDTRLEAWRKITKQMQANAARATRKITLDVGGRLFSTSKDTLLKLEGTYFHAMLTSGQWQPDANGAFFIDANPKHFDRILDFLRTGERDLHGLDVFQLNKLRKLAEYFQVPLMPTMQWDPQVCSQHLKLSKEGTVVTKTGGGTRWNSAVLGTTPCELFSIRYNGRCVTIGFATKDNFRVNEVNSSQCGWYLSAQDGTLWSGDGVENKKYLDGPLRTGSTLTCLFDDQRKQISFEVDGKSLGVAFRQVSASELYPAVEISTVGASLALVP